jgi:outer membrane protein TolC
MLKSLIFAVTVSAATLSRVGGQQLLTIERAMDVAQDNNPTLKRLLANLEQYQQSLAAERASLKSRFSLNLTPVDYSKTRSFDNRLSQWYTNEKLSSSGSFQAVQPILWTDGTISLINVLGWQDNYSEIEGLTNSNRAFSNNLYLQLSQPIFTYNRRKMALKRIEYEYENANISHALQRLETERQITAQFYTVYTVQSDLQTSREELANAEQSYDIIKNKVEADLAAGDELFQAELNLATARSQTDGRKVELENAKDKLKQLLDMPLDEDFTVVAEINVEPVPVDRQKAITHGLESRLELRRRELQSAELDFRMIETKALNEFKGDVTLSYGLVGDHSNFGRIYGSPTQNPRIIVGFTIPIFDWGEKKARIRAQEVAQKINRMDDEQDRIDIELNIRQVCRSLENLWTHIKIAGQNVRNAQLTYDLNLTRYREGDINGMQISQFQVQLSSKKADYTKALINYKIELLNLKILSLYDFENAIEIVPLKGVKNDR